MTRKVQIGGEFIKLTDNGEIIAAGALLPTSGILSGQIVVAAAGTAVQGTSVANANGFYVKAHPSNTGAVWFGDNGAGSAGSASGYPLNPGEQVIVSVANLSQLWFDAAVSGEKACWLKA